MNVIKRVVLTSTILLSAIASLADSISYVPEFHGVVRTRWEIETESGKSHFQVRHARISADGHIAPFLGYFIHADFCDKGAFKILDAYTNILPAKGLKLQAGQFRMPFGVETFRAPLNYYFADRAFMQKDMCNYRRVGFSASYNLPVRIPILLEAGAFNNASIADHTKWSKSYAFSGKASLTLGEFKVSGGAMGVKPDAKRLYMYDAAVEWQHRNLYAAAEYMNQHYAGGIYDDSHSWSAMLDYHHPMRSRIFNQWSVQGRFDGITRYWDGFSGSGLQPGRNRITVGGTLTYKWKILFADLRLNYEKYFYKSGVTAPEGLGDKVVAEFVVRF